MAQTDDEAPTWRPLNQPCNKAVTVAHHWGKEPKSRHECQDKNSKGWEKHQEAECEIE